MDEDLILIEQFQKGDKTAFDALMQRHYRAVLNLVYRFTGVGGEAAEDMAQEIFLRVYKALPRFEARARFFTYLYKVTMNYCFKEREKINRNKGKVVSLDRKWDDPDISDTGGAPDPNGSALEQYERNERSNEIAQAIAKLPQEQRVVVVLYRFRQLSYEQIAETLELSLPAVKSRLHRAKLSLQKSLGKSTKGE